MRVSINARVTGHKLFCPDPKQPNVELVRVELEFAPVGTAATDKNSRGALIIDLKELSRWPLRSSVRVDLEDVQQVLPLARAANGKAKDQAAHARDDPR